MIEMTTQCRQCGKEHQPDHSDFVRNRWRICRQCRDGLDATGIRSHVTPVQGRTDEPRASNEATHAQNERITTP